MRLSLRFIIPLGIALAAIAYAVVPLVDQLTLRWFVRDLEIRASLVSNTAQEPLVTLVQKKSRQEVLKLFNSIIRNERIYALGFCDTSGNLVYSTLTYPAQLGCRTPVNGTTSWVTTPAEGALHVAHNSIEPGGNRLGDLVVIHDMSYVQRRSDDTKKYLYYLFAAIAAIVAFITVVIAEISWRGWMAGIKGLISGETLFRSPGAPNVTPRELRPIARDLHALVQDLAAERASRDEEQIGWGPEALRRILREDLKGDEVLIVSNREPYIHVRNGNEIEIQRPASGLVTALEPVMRACSGTWIAHGAGSADRDTVDARDRVMVPPEKPAYRIRRVWLTKEEEEGYYYGFSNEGLWPLCHIAHTRPVFRTPDWEHYKTVNQRFADAVVSEARSRNPIVLVQDYHFALLPRMIREQLPDATIIAFWHIPWPNPEAFGILPWREELLEGMLGASVLGFHTQFHCNNFFDTVDRYLEARIDRETFNISYRGEKTEVRRYPISIEWPPAALAGQPSIHQSRRQLRERLGASEGLRIGIGVDRLDYTKGILERFLAVERLLEVDPSSVGRFSFVQIAAPSRSSIPEYQELEAKVRALADRINKRFGHAGYLPIILLIEYHNEASVFSFYRAADLCYVSSLHDGMNLVAKEFIASRDDEMGVLVLSQFAGASRELVEALIVNPYDIEQCAAALKFALEMPPEEQRSRMRGMRALVQEFNVFRWAGRMLIDAARIRNRRNALARSSSLWQPLGKP